jgi:hypothetical protein
MVRNTLRNGTTIRDVERDVKARGIYTTFCGCALVAFAAAPARPPCAVLPPRLLARAAQRRLRPAPRAAGSATTATSFLTKGPARPLRPSFSGPLNSTLRFP